MLKFLLVLTALATLVLAQGKTCDRRICMSAFCIAQTEEQCKAKNMDFKPYDAICFCCDGCTPYIPEGGKCGSDENYYYQSCKPGTTCSDGTCRKQ